MTTLRSSENINMEAGWGVMNAPFIIPEECEFPMPDAMHVRAAEAYFRFASELCKPCLAYRILLKAEEFGVKVNNPSIYFWANKFRL